MQCPETNAEQSYDSKSRQKKSIYNREESFFFTLERPDNEAVFSTAAPTHLQRWSGVIIAGWLANQKGPAQGVADKLFLGNTH